MVFHGPKDPVYTISVAARLLGVAPQFLRQVENEGLVSPSRTDSNIRLYSDDDLRLLSRIVYLCRERGVNLQGVRVILAMEDGEREDTKNQAEEEAEPDGQSGGGVGPILEGRSGAPPDERSNFGSKLSPDCRSGAHPNARQDVGRNTSRKA